MALIAELYGESRRTEEFRPQTHPRYLIYTYLTTTPRYPGVPLQTTSVPLNPLYLQSMLT
ncbi:hypothetical protein XPA_008784 [Xanthoria parietina]